jgi:hypothetical protein
MNISLSNGKPVIFHGEVQSAVVKHCSFKVDLPEHDQYGEGEAILTQFRLILMRK